MSYSTSSPPTLIAGNNAAGTRLWMYASTDVHTDVDATDYFSDGHALGMRVNDVVIVIKTSATIGATIHVVTASTSGGAATVAPAILS